MCGRFALKASPGEVREALGYLDQPNFPPRFNIAPTQPIAVVREEARERRFVLMRWGFIPEWAEDPKTFPLIFNVRSESAAEKPAFKNALRRRRALIPGDGFYEWQAAGVERRPHLVRRRDGGIFAFAALWETYAGKDGAEIDTAAIITGPANATLAPLHPRCPIIVGEGDFARWLDPNAAAGDVSDCLRPPPDDLLEAIRIGPAINKATNDDPDVQRPHDPALDDVDKPLRRSAKSAQGSNEDQGSLF